MVHRTGTKTPRLYWLVQRGACPPGERVKGAQWTDFRDQVNALMSTGSTCECFSRVLQTRRRDPATGRWGRIPTSHLRLLKKISSGLFNLRLNRVCVANWNQWRLRHEPYRDKGTEWPSMFMSFHSLVCRSVPACGDFANDVRWAPPSNGRVCSPAELGKAPLQSDGRAIVATSTDRTLRLARHLVE